jgi:hypothetical protein
LLAQGGDFEELGFLVMVLFCELVQSGSLALLLQISQNTARFLSSLIFRVFLALSWEMGESEKHHENRKN